MHAFLRIGLKEATCMSRIEPLVCAAHLQLCFCLRANPFLQTAPGLKDVLGPQSEFGSLSHTIGEACILQKTDN